MSWWRAIKQQINLSQLPIFQQNVQCCKLYASMVLTPLIRLPMLALYKLVLDFIIIIISVDL